jgi:hypothetical protein
MLSKAKTYSISKMPNEENPFCVQRDFLSGEETKLDDCHLNQPPNFKVLQVFIPRWCYNILAALQESL